MEFGYLITSDDVEVLEHTVIESDDGISEPYHDVVIIRNNYDGRVRIENVPPEEFLISREAKSIEDARFVCHRVRKTLSELRIMYPDQDFGPEDLGSGDDDAYFSAERLSRYEFDDSENYGFGVEMKKEGFKNIGYMSHL